MPATLNQTSSSSSANSRQLLNMDVTSNARFVDGCPRVSLMISVATVASSMWMASSRTHSEGCECPTIRAKERGSTLRRLRYLSALRSRASPRARSTLTAGTLPVIAGYEVPATGQLAEVWLNELRQWNTWRWSSRPDAVVPAHRVCCRVDNTCPCDVVSGKKCEAVQHSADMSNIFAVSVYLRQSNHTKLTWCWWWWSLY